MRRLTVEMVRAFAEAAVSPQAAQTMFRISRRTELAQPARAWLESHPRQTIAGLVEMVSNRDPLSTEASRFLQTLKIKGHAEILEEVLKTASPDVVREINDTRLPDEVETIPFDDETTPDWLRRGLSESISNWEVPAWLLQKDLPPLVVGKGHLNQDQVRRLLWVFQNIQTSRVSELPNAPFFNDLSQKVGQESMLKFLWPIFEAWRKGGSLNEGWAVFPLGIWGNDETAINLYTSIEPRPGNYNSFRDAIIFEALRGIGTPTALTYLRRHANTPNLFQSAEKARVIYNSIAAERGISPNELELQTIPDCGINQEGRRIFDYGPRKIIVTVGFNFEPVISNEFGKNKPRLPAPVRKDNPELSARAKQEWLLVKKQLQLIRKVQLPEFESAMVRRRTWEADSFFRYLVPHPVMNKLCRGLVWGAFTNRRAFLTAFRVCEDNSLSSRNDRNFTLPPECRIGIVHPALMSVEEYHHWVDIFQEYFLPQPFPQLNRPIGRLTENEWKDDRITRFNSIPIDERLIKQRLYQKGWTGPDYFHQKPEICIKHFSWLKVTAVVDYNREKITYPRQPFYWQKRTIRECYFLSEYGSSKLPVYSQPKIPLHLIDPIIVSEVLADLTDILANQLH